MLFSGAFYIGGGTEMQLNYDCPGIMHVVPSLVPSPTPSFSSLLSTVKRQKAGRGTGNEAMLYH